MLGCKWVGTIPWPPLCACMGTSWGDTFTSAKELIDTGLIKSECVYNTKYFIFIYIKFYKYFCIFTCRSTSPCTFWHLVCAAFMGHAVIVSKPSHTMHYGVKIQHSIHFFSTVIVYN
jgi:hypothetical protein